jgi:hypothetical protein
MNMIEEIAKGIKQMDSKSLFALSGACLVEINTRIANKKLELKDN